MIGSYLTIESTSNELKHMMHISNNIVCYDCKHT